MIEGDLVSWLTTDTDIDTLISKDEWGNARIQYGLRPSDNVGELDDDGVEINFFRVSNPRYFWTLDLKKPVFQISIWSRRLEKARAMADAIESRISQFSGQQDNSIVELSLVDTDSETYDPQGSMWQIAIDVRIVYFDKPN